MFTFFKLWRFNPVANWWCCLVSSPAKITNWLLYWTYVDGYLLNTVTALLFNLHSAHGRTEMRVGFFFLYFSIYFSSLLCCFVSRANTQRSAERATWNIKSTDTLATHSTHNNQNYKFDFSLSFFLFFFLFLSLFILLLRLPFYCVQYRLESQKKWQKKKMCKSQRDNDTAQQRLRKSASNRANNFLFLLPFYFSYFFFFFLLLSPFLLSVRI